jgi:acyl-ACP thioesterase
MGHVNNAATWEPVEDELDRRRLVPVRAEVEYRDAIDPRDTVELRSAAEGDELRVWLLVAGAVRASAVVLTAPL